MKYDVSGVTTILPVYLSDTGESRIRCLRHAIESVRGQRFPSEYEILVVDDGSPCPVRAVAPDLETRPVRFIREEANGGVARALNRGLAEARFPMIARIDADDVWLEGKIEKQFALFRDDPDMTIVGTGMTLATPTGDRLQTHIRPSDWAWIIDFIVRGGSPFPHGSVLARRDVYSLLGGYPVGGALRYCEDYALWAVWVRFFQPGMVEDVLYHYTVSPHSVSVRFHDEQIRGTQLVQKQIAKLLPTRVPDALSELASLAQCTLFEAGVLAFKMWRYGTPVLLPSAAVECLRLIMPDRKIVLRRFSHNSFETGAAIGNAAVATRVGARVIHACRLRT